MRWILASVIGALMVASAYGQSMPNSPAGQMAARSHGVHAAEPPDPNKPKPDEKAYNAALKNLPDKQYDPWRGVR
jgi:hypothetical protein